MSRASALLSATAVAAALGAQAAGPRPSGKVPSGQGSTSAHSVVLVVDPRGIARSHSVAAVELDFERLLRERGDAGSFDQASLEVIAVDEAGVPRAFDESRAGRERFLVPWRLERYHPGSRARLSFVMRDETHARFRVAFDTVESGRGDPRRYHGLVGDGDRFAAEWGRREVAASGYDTFADLDGDGDRDLVQGGTGHRLRYLENTGAGRFVDRGLLASDGRALELPHDDGGRSWVSPAACDWDGDGDADLLLQVMSGPAAGQVLRYENVAEPGGAWRVAERGPLKTVTGVLVPGAVTCADWDGDGRLDLLSAFEGLIAFHRNVGTSRALADMQLADGQPLEAAGATIELNLARPAVGDLDGDGDLDLVVGTDEGRVFLFENVGGRALPVLARGRMVVYHGYMDARTGVEVADFDGDGLLDLVVGRYWRRTSWGDAPVVHGRLYRNVGPARSPRFEEKDAASGAPYVEGFLPVDALRQNAARVADWDEDGRPDLVVGDTDGFVWLFRSLGRGHFALFERGRRLEAGGAALRVLGEEAEGRRAGYARPEVADWNGDGRKDLLVADARGWLTLFRNAGTEAAPVLALGVRVEANGKPIDGTGRASVLVADWNGDGRKDVILAMAGEDRSRDYDWEHRNADPSLDRGILFYRNLGTDAAPALAFPQWVRAGRFGGQPIDLRRPNLGSFVDWDGDGRKDLIACEFEDTVRLFRNTARQPGRPRFTAAERGDVLLAGEILEAISGAVAFDWDGDGDLDLVTGEGHAGSGLRFYEGDYLRDLSNGTLPVVRLETGREAGR